MFGLLPLPLIVLFLFHLPVSLKIYLFVIEGQLLSNIVLVSATYSSLETSC